MPSNFDQSRWLMNHTAQLNQHRTEWERQGYTVYTEGQNRSRSPGRWPILIMSSTSLLTR